MSPAAVIRSNRFATVRLALVTLLSLWGYFLGPWVKTGKTLHGLGDVAAVEKAAKASQGLLKLFGVIGWLPLVAALACAWLAFLHQHRKALLASAGLSLLTLVWLGLWFNRLVAGKPKFQPAAGWVLMFFPFLVLTLGMLKQAIGAVPAVGQGLGKIGGTVGRGLGNKAATPVIIAAILAFGMFAVPELWGSYWVAAFTQTAITAALAASVGLLYGRVGLVSLGQVAPYGIGTWVTMRLAFATSLPFPVLLIIGGVVAALLGMIIGLPALRVSGLYLALVTLMLAAAVELVLGQIKFPNGGTGFKGVAEDLGKILPVRRPSFAETDFGYFRFTVVIVFLLFMLAAFFLARKPGRTWASIRQSEAAAISTGVDITRYKLWAFALAAFIAGVAGGLFAGSVPKGMSIDGFSKQAAIFLIAAVIMGGVDNLWGAVLAGFFATCLLKFLTQNVIGHQFWNDFSFSLFGFGLIMNLIQSTKAMEKKGLI